MWGYRSFFYTFVRFYIQKNEAESPHGISKDTLTEPPTVALKV